MSLDHVQSGRRYTAVEVHTPARLHIGMLSFGVPEVRSFGGVGFMIDRPGVCLRMERAERFAAHGPLAERAVESARACVRAWDLGDAACTIEVLEAPGSHLGLGSGTQLGLAVAAGLRHLFRPPATAEAAAAGPSAGGEWSFDARDAVELARGSGRGRRSCIGVYGFGGGGMIVEGGRLLRDEHAAGDDSARGFSPLLARVRLPAEWRCVVVGQRGAVGLHGDAEKQAFAALPPVPREISAELSRIALMDLLPAAIEGRFTEFSDAVFRYGELAGKPFEQASSRLPHAGTTAALIGWLQEAGVRGCAQSSWGPTVMACCPTPAAAEDLAARLATAYPAGTYEPTIARFDPQGAVLRELPGDQARPTGRP